MGQHGKHVVWLGLTPEPSASCPSQWLLSDRLLHVEKPAASAHQSAPTRLRPVRLGQLPWTQLRRLRPIGPARPAAAWQDAEVARIERLILHGTQRAWLRYLAEVTALITRAAAERRDETSTRLALHAAETVLDHHRMLIGLPGPAYERVAAERDALAATVTALRERLTSS